MQKNAKNESNQKKKYRNEKKNNYETRLVISRETEKKFENESYRKKRRLREEIKVAKCIRPPCR